MRGCHRLEELIIQKVREHDVLFDTRSSKYRDQNRRQEAWDEIAKQLGIKAEKAKEEWEKLRRCFTNALGRRRAKPTGQSATVSRWKYEEQMAFLVPFLKLKTNVGGQESEYTFSSDTLSSTLSTEDMNWAKDPLADVKDDLIDFYQEELVNKRLNDSVVYEDLSNKRAKIDESLSNGPSEDMLSVIQEEPAFRYQDIDSPPQTSPQTSPQAAKYNDLDESDMFYLSMSRTAKRLSKAAQAKIKLMLSKLVLEAEIVETQSSSSLVVSSTNENVPTTSYPSSFIVMTHPDHR